MKNLLLTLFVIVLIGWFGWGEDYFRSLPTTRSPKAGSDREDIGYIKYGLGVGPSGEPSLTSTKTLALGRQFNLLPNIVQQLEGGFWSDASGIPGRSSSPYGGWSAGVNIEAGYLNIQSLWGVAWLTEPDSLLGGPFQFHQDFFIGVKDEYNCSIGLNYSHMSSAGLENPNRGRDFVTLRVGIPW